MFNEKETIDPSELLDKTSKISIHVKVCSDALLNAMSKLHEAYKILSKFQIDVTSGNMTYEEAEENYFSKMSDLSEDAVYCLR